MSRESQTERYRLLIASIAEYRRASEDVSRIRWSDLNIPEAQSVPRHKPTIYPEILEHAFENTSVHSLHESQKRAFVKFNLAPMPQSFNLPAVFNMSINKVGGSPQSLVAVVDMLVSIVSENEHHSIISLTSEDYQRLTKAQDKLSAIVGEDENHLLAPLINFISNLIKIHHGESNPSTQADLLSQETDDPEHTDAATLKPHRPEKVGRPATRSRLKLTDLLSQETDDSTSDEIDTGPAVGNEV